MTLVELKRDPTPREVRQFGLIWLPAFCALAAAWTAFRFGISPAAAFVACGVVSLLVTWARPSWMRGVFLAWMWAAFPIGWLVAHVLMAMIYFLVVTPIGLAMRAAGRDPLARNFDRAAASYWTPRPRQPETSDYFRQF